MYSMTDHHETLRTVRRLTPKQPATVSVYRDEQRLAYGTLPKPSVSGACIVTDSRLAPAAGGELAAALL